MLFVFVGFELLKCMLLNHTHFIIFIMYLLTMYNILSSDSDEKHFASKAGFQSSLHFVHWKILWIILDNNGSFVHVFFFKSYSIVLKENNYYRCYMYNTNFFIILEKHWVLGTNCWPCCIVSFRLIITNFLF